MTLMLSNRHTDLFRFYQRVLLESDGVKDLREPTRDGERLTVLDKDKRIVIMAVFNKNGRVERARYPVMGCGGGYS